MAVLPWQHLLSHLGKEKKTLSVRLIIHAHMHTCLYMRTSLVIVLETTKYTVCKGNSRGNRFGFKLVKGLRYTKG